MNNTRELVTAERQTAVSILDAPQQQREAWRLLKANQSNAKDIDSDRWRLLAVAFASTPDEILTRAVIMHMTESPFFPRLSDIKAQIDKLVVPSPFDVFRAAMARAGYIMTHDDGTEAHFEGNGITPVVYH